jgi:glutaconate CoA-transferase, subunit B
MASDLKLDPNVATPSEIMAARAAEELKNGDVVFVGIGLPNLACNLARATHAPDLCMIYESGAVGAVPDRLPVSIGDPALVTDSLAVVGMADIFQNYLQRGFIEVGFLGGAQVDRFGNINTTVIGNYKNPKVRLPGSGGACEIAVHSRRLLIVMRMSPKSFVEKCDFITSPGQRSHGKSRKDLKLPGSGPLTTITDLCVCEFIDDEMVVTEIYPGVTEEKIKASCGWPIKFKTDLKKTPPPSQKVIDLLRHKLDPQRMYL